MTKPARFILVGFAALLLAAAANPGRAFAACGDVNNSGAANADDVVCLQATIANGGTPPAITQCNPGPVCLPGMCDMFGDGTPGGIADLAFLVADLNGIETLHDLCAPIGSPVTCLGPVDAETGKPTLSLGGGGDVTISASEIWPNTCTIILEDTVFVETPPASPTTVLTIQAGTVIKGEAGNVTPVTPALIFLPGSKIEANGSPASPIVFTSTAADGAKSKGDWGGVMINGRSIVNRSLVGPCQNEAEGIPTPYGGCIETDSSGRAQFVRVEYAGLDFTPNNELNLWTMNAVGNGTLFRFIQAHAGDDDCHEWFGGTVNEDHLVASACGDDGFDSQLGFQGSLQFGLMVQNGTLTDATNRDSRGIEQDNSEFDNDALPRTNPDMCNLTMIGARAQAGENGGSDSGILFRRGTASTVANSIVTAFQDAGVELRDVSTTVQACTNPTTLAGNLTVRSTVFFENGDFPGAGTEQCKSGTIAGGNCSTCEWYGLLVGSEDVEPPNGTNGCDPGLSDQYPLVDVPDYRPSFSGTCPTATSCSAINDLFVDTSYIGAINPGAACSGTQCDWLSTPWLNFDPDGNVYP